MTTILPSWRRAAIPVLTLLLCLAAQGLSLERRELGERITKDNKTFECSFSGACVICSYSEKSDEKYHCSETGYHMPYKCIEVQSDFKEVNKERIEEDSYHVKDKSQVRVTNSHKDEQLENRESQQMDDQIDDTGNKGGNWRRLAETTYSLEHGKQTYHIFRSCVPPADEEKLSVLGFEGIVFGLLLISSPIVYYRKKRNFVMPGATRTPTMPGATRTPTTRDFKILSSR